MTKFEFYSKSPRRMAELIEQAVDDALAAKGCSLELKLPAQMSEARDNRLVTWETLLEEEL